MNEQHHEVFNYANLCKENSQKIVGDNNLQTYNNEPNTGEKFNLLMLPST